MSAQNALAQLRASAGERVDQPFALLLKLFNNIKKQPHEEKVRRLNLGNARLQDQLFCFDGARELLAAAGFVVEAGDGARALVLAKSSGAAVAFSDAHVALQRTYAQINEARQRAAAQEESEVSEPEKIKEVLASTAGDTARSDMLSLAQSPDGREALQTLSKVVQNLIRFPQSEKYRSLCLSGKAGPKLRAVLPILRLIGFKGVKRKDDNEEHLEVGAVSLDVLERFNAMLFWSLNDAAAAVQLPTGTGSLQHALGAVLGAAVGDALGTALEMTNCTIHTPVTAQELDKAMEMCGGGKWGVAPGQITDDTEMQLMLAEALATATTSTFPREEAAKNYHEWGASGPFDIGVTTRRAVWGHSSDAGDMEHRAWEMNQSSQANGSLMRCMPLAVWGCARKLPPRALAAAARADAKLTHSNSTVGTVTAAYAVAASHLVQSCGDRRGAMQAMDSWRAEELRQGTPGHEKLSQWCEEAMGEAPLPYGPEYGWAKIGFTHAIRQLALGSDFETAMRHAIVGGGDTDTNAAIVGGLVGAAVGLGGIPERWLRGVLAADSPRPERFHPKRLPLLVSQIYDAAAK
mmetsp:Transcript_115226/g.279583  ORF Transcript_115226/g.279583 Transcript_115226/m.279583 type:complete len:577 (-) Transcript_115226:137-1867(-)